jgi:hypothetical protein
VYLAPVALSLYREDGSMPRFVAASPPVTSTDERENEEGETCSALNAFNVRVLTSWPVETRSLTGISMTSTDSTEVYKAMEGTDLPY